MEINVLIDSEFEDCLDATELQSTAEQVVTAAEVSSNVELGLFITSQGKIRELNRTYRGIDEPTDVLSFSLLPATREEEGVDTPFVTAPDGVLHLGEVTISYPQAVAQALEHKHSIFREITILIIHGVLHLMGYDHEEPEEACQMSAREAEILSRVEVGA